MNMCIIFESVNTIDPSQKSVAILNKLFRDVKCGWKYFAFAFIVNKIDLLLCGKYVFEVLKSFSKAIAHVSWMQNYKKHSQNILIRSWRHKLFKMATFEKGLLDMS